MNILVIDDEVSIADLLRDIFKSINQECTSCYSGNEAIEYLKNQEYDLIISDVKMPDGDGPSVIKFINENNINCRFYFMTGQSEYSEEELLSFGALKVYRKPLDLDRLTQEMVAQIN